jgi:hypothetical protein
MVLMKNAANAFAPSGVCWVASNGISGGFSPGFVFGPVRGTSAGMVGRVGRGGPGSVDDDELLGTTVVCSGVGACEGVPPDDDVHAAAQVSAARNAANVQIHRTHS